MGTKKLRSRAMVGHAASMMYVIAMGKYDVNKINTIDKNWFLQNAEILSIFKSLAKNNNYEKCLEITNLKFDELQAGDMLAKIDGDYFNNCDGYYIVLYGDGHYAAVKK